ncbi:hypothetical protein ACC668_37655, partial [Rhizobium ruizarguesonis]
VDLTSFRRIVIQVLSGLTAYGYYAGSLTGVVDEDTRGAEPDAKVQQPQDHRHGNGKLFHLGHTTRGAPTSPGRPRQ